MHSTPKISREGAGICYTPNTEDGTADFKFFCPLCMVHFKEIQKTTCCTNYVCRFCAGELPHESCPFCAQDNMQLIDESCTADARKYLDSPSLKKKMAQLSPSPFSPIKCGDGFAELQRKVPPLTPMADLALLKGDSTQSLSDSVASVASSSAQEYSTMSQSSIGSVVSVPDLAAIEEKEKEDKAADKEDKEEASMSTSSSTIPRIERISRPRAGTVVVAPSSSFLCGCVPSDKKRKTKTPKSQESCVCVIC